MDSNTTPCADMEPQGSPTQTCHFCPIPRFTPDFAGPSRLQASTIADMHTGLRWTEGKAELHRVLQAVQHSVDYGVFVCEDFRDPRRFYVDDYWHEVKDDAFGIDELHRQVGRVDNSPLPDHVLARLHRFARLLERLARRIDRVVVQSEVI